MLDEILKKFQDAAEHPEALKERYLAEGKQIVLVAPVYTPEEIVHSWAWSRWAPGAAICS